MIGFFCISGYLIAANRNSKSFGDYLSLRIARIFPAFIACNTVTVIVFAPIAYRHFHGTLDGYLSTGTTPLSYLFNSMGLKMLNYDVAATPLGVPYPGFGTAHCGASTTSSSATCWSDCSPVWRSTSARSGAH